MKIIFYYHANKTHFHKKGFALGLILRVRVFGTRKWHIDRFHSRDKNLDNRCYAAILVYRNVNKLVAVLRVEHGFVSNR